MRSDRTSYCYTVWTMIRLVLHRPFLGTLHLQLLVGRSELEFGRIFPHPLQSLPNTHPLLHCLKYSIISFNIHLVPLPCIITIITAIIYFTGKSSFQIR